MKGIDIVAPISGWRSWYSTGGIITMRDDKINVSSQFINQGIGLGRSIDYGIWVLCWQSNWFLNVLMETYFQWTIL